MFISSSVGWQLPLPGDSNKELDLSLSTWVAEAGRSLSLMQLCLPRVCPMHNLELGVCPMHYLELSDS